MVRCERCTKPLRDGLPCRRCADVARFRRATAYLLERLAEAEWIAQMSGDVARLKDVDGKRQIVQMCAQMMCKRSTDRTDSLLVRLKWIVDLLAREWEESPGYQRGWREPLAAFEYF